MEIRTVGKNFYIVNGESVVGRVAKAREAKNYLANFHSFRSAADMDVDTLYGIVSEIRNVIVRTERECGSKIRWMKFKADFKKVVPEVYRVENGGVHVCGNGWHLSVKWKEPGASDISIQFSLFEEENSFLHNCGQFGLSFEDYGKEYKLTIKGKPKKAYLRNLKGTHAILQCGKKFYRVGAEFVQPIAELPQAA